MAALAIDLAVHSLELCNIRCEVLGFTTRFGDDNPIADLWRIQVNDERTFGQVCAFFCLETASASARSRAAIWSKSGTD